MRLSLSPMPTPTSASASATLLSPISDGRLLAAGRIALEWSRLRAMLMAMGVPERQGLARPLAYGEHLGKVTRRRAGMRGAQEEAHHPRRHCPACPGNPCLSTRRKMDHRNKPGDDGGDEYEASSNETP